MGSLVRALAGAALAFLAAGCAQSDRLSAASDEVALVLPDSTQESETRRRARLRVELASGYYQQRNLPVAIDEARQAIAIDGTYVPAFALLGLIYVDLGDPQRAEETFQRGLRQAPGDPELNNNYGWFLCQSERVRAAIAYFERASRNRLYATPAKPLHNAGVCLLRVGDIAAAESWLLKAFQADPNDVVAMYNLAEIYLKRPDFARARFYVRRLTNTMEPTAEVLWLGVRVERAAGDFDAQASFATQLRRRFPQSREASLLESGLYEQ
jgi:type IV pilus assembly protein PilF